MLRAIYRFVLLTCPSEVRREIGAEMTDVFVHCVEVEQARCAVWWRPIVWTRGFTDTLLFAVQARRDARAFHAGRSGARPGRARRPIMRSQDIRSTIRLMRTRPMFAASIVGMLALGIGATTAIFSVISGVLLRPLPFAEPDRIVQVWGSVPARGLTRNSLTEANFWDMRDMNRTFEEFGAWHGASFTLMSAEGAERVGGAMVSAGFFRALGAPPVAGRLFEPGEDNSGAPGDRVLLSFGYWSRRFGGNRGIVGQTISLDGRPYQVVGVLASGTPWLDSADVFVPFVRRPKANRGSWEYVGIGRLKKEVSFEAGIGDLERVARELETAYPDTNRGASITMGRSRDWIASDALRRTLWILLGATGLLLVIACVNVTNLLLAHASARARETAVRTALGAGRADLVRERLTEAMVFSAASAIAGTSIAWGMLRGFKAMDPGGIPRLADVTLNGSMLAFAVLVAALVGIVTGLVPALRAPVADIVRALRHGQRGTVGDRVNDRLRNVLVGAEVALALTLLVGAGLLVKSLTRVLAVDRGFQTEARLLATVSIPGAFPEERRTQIVTEILTRLEQLPAVKSVAAVSGRPLSGGSTGLGIVAADHPDIAEADVPWASWRIVTKDYFRTMGLPLVAGRGFTEHDLISKPWRAIVSKRLADLLWPGESPIGKTAILWKGQGNQKSEVIGVVGNMRERGLENDPTLAVYFPAYGAMGATSLQLVMHTAGRPEDVTPALRSVVSGIDRSLPVSGVRTLEEIVTRSVATRRFTMLLLAVFAGLAVVLSLAGVWGVLAYTVARRTAEIGIRLALGAAPGQVLRRVFARGLRPVLAGLAVGLTVTFWLSQLMTSLLFGVEPRDVTTYLMVTAGLLATAALACYWPARRVLGVDPVIALRD